MLQVNVIDPNLPTQHPAPFTHRSLGEGGQHPALALWFLSECLFNLYFLVSFNYIPDFDIVKIGYV